MTQQATRIGESAADSSCPENAKGGGHHWAIESPNGPTSFGTCKRCGEHREFKNSIQITSWESEGSHANRNRG